MTVKDAVAVPAELAAEQFTVVVPIGKVQPDGNEQTGVTDPAPVSFAVTLKATTAPSLLAALTMMLLGMLTIGGPKLNIAKLWLEPAAIDTTVLPAKTPLLVTGTGTQLSVVVLFPSSPEPLEPQPNMRLSVCRISYQQLVFFSNSSEHYEKIIV